MPRPISGTAQTPAERVATYRSRKAERGEGRVSVELTPEARTKADTAAAEQGINRTAYVNALVMAAG